MKRLMTAALLMILFLVTLLIQTNPLQAACTSWNLANDWDHAYPNQINPETDACRAYTWYFMKKDPAGYTKLTSFRSSAWGYPGIEGWEPAIPDFFNGFINVPYVFKNFTSSAWSYEGITGWPANTVTLQPGNVSRAVVAWKSPITGNVQVSAKFTFRCLENLGNGLNWYVDKGSTLLGTGFIYPAPGTAATFSQTIAVSKGAYLYFAVDANGSAIEDPIGDVAQVDVTIKKVR